MIRLGDTIVILHNERFNVQVSNNNNKAHSVFSFTPQLFHSLKAFTKVFF